MSKLTDIYNTGVGHDHEAGLQAVWDAAITSMYDISQDAFVKPTEPELPMKLTKKSKASDAEVVSDPVPASERPSE